MSVDLNFLEGEINGEEGDWELRRSLCVCVYVTNDSVS